MLRIATAASLLAVVAALASRGGPLHTSSRLSPRIVWEGAMSEARAAHQASMLPDGGVLITGGCRASGCRPILASAEIYDPVTRTFDPTESMQTPRASHAGVALVDGRVLVVGGWTGTSATATAELYDPTRRRFAAAGDMSEARESPSAIRLPDGRVLVVGGTTAEIFDPVTDRFSTLGPLLRVAPSLTLLADGRVLVTGGDRSRGDVLQTAVIFDPATNGFEPTGDMTVPRHKHGAARLSDGRVLIVGGSDARDGRGLYASTEVYEPKRGTFTDGPRLRTARHKIQDAVVALPSGAILVGGGATQPELWDPASEEFVPVAGTLSGAQMFATASVLTTGEVLILGGYDDRIRPSAGAWLVSLAR